mgnify:FL=1
MTPTQCMTIKFLVRSWCLASCYKYKLILLHWMNLHLDFALNISPYFFSIWVTRMQNLKWNFMKLLHINCHSQIFKSWCGGCFLIIQIKFFFENFQRTFEIHVNKIWSSLHNAKKSICFLNRKQLAKMDMNHDTCLYVSLCICLLLFGME